MRSLLPGFLARMLTLAVAVTLCGCTAIGLGMDVAHRDPRAGEGAALSRLRKVRPGSAIVVTMRDGSRLEGTFAGVARASSAATGGGDARSRDLGVAVPTETVVQLNVSGGRAEARPEDIESWVVTRPAPRGPRWTLVGILADVLVLVWINTTFIYSG